MIECLYRKRVKNMIADYLEGLGINLVEDDVLDDLVDQLFDEFDNIYE